MANEARVSSGLTIKMGGLDYQTRPGTFSVTVSVANGPTPGAITVTEEGTDVDLSQLASPGLCWICNLDPTNHVDVGIWDPELVTFYPLQEVGPLENYPLKLSRNIGGQYGTGTGTGTSVVGNNRLRLRAYGGDCIVRVEAFDR